MQTNLLQPAGYDKLERVYSPDTHLCQTPSDQPWRGAAKKHAACPPWSGTTQHHTTHEMRLLCRQWDESGQEQGCCLLSAVTANIWGQLLLLHSMPQMPPHAESMIRSLLVPPASPAHQPPRTQPPAAEQYAALAGCVEEAARLVQLNARMHAWHGHLPIAGSGGSSLLASCSTAAHACMRAGARAHACSAHAGSDSFWLFFQLLM
jgi:hypothetical protein